MSDATTRRQDIGRFYAERCAVLLEYAVSRWPDHAATFHQTGSEISAALLDRLPPGTAAGTGNSLRQRLTGGLEK